MKTTASLLLGATGSPADSLYYKVDVGIEQFIGELSIAYRIYESPNAFVNLYTGLNFKF